VLLSEFHLKLKVMTIGRPNQSEQENVLENVVIGDGRPVLSEPWKSFGLFILGLRAGCFTPANT
jgi:hypothetical protein